jgi:hypothetical protein
MFIAANKGGNPDVLDYVIQQGCTDDETNTTNDIN